MTKGAVTCTSKALVESMLDGRLDRGDKASVERHLATCESCAGFLGDLERLRAEVRRDVAPVPSEFRLAHGRLALLRRAAGEPTTNEPRFRPALIVAGAVMIALFAVFVGWSRSAPRAELHRFAPAVPLAAKVTFVSSTDSKVTAANADGRFDLELVDGTVSVWVRKLGAGQRVLVTTRDAAVEVRGTVFRVTAAHGKLLDVNVDNGVVEVRRGDERRFIHAGENLDLRQASAAEPPAIDVDRLPSAPISPTPASEASAVDAREASAIAMRARSADASPGSPGFAERPAVLAARGEAPSEAKSPAANPSAVAASPPVPKRDAAADDFSRAVGELDHADYPGAAEKLSAFVKHHPDDARAEDAAFLAVVALQKTGKRAEMLVAARDYLRRFPNGARSADVRRWVAAP